MKKLSTNEFIRKANIKHNWKYDYSLSLYKGSKTPLIIKCPEGHIFEQNPNDHLNGHGCKICAGWGIMKNDNEEFIRRANKIHSGIYDYSKTTYIGHTIPVIIKCPIHGEFKITPKEHIIKKHGCQKCGIEKSALNRTWTTDKFIERAREIHGSKYDYSLVEYKNANIKVKIICPTHGIFEQNLRDHINGGNGCPKCNSSKGENKIRVFLENNNIKFIPEHIFFDCINKKTNRKLPFDFYLPEFNIIIEFHGIQHYEQIRIFEGKRDGFKERKSRDRIKERYCLKNNIPIIKISYKKINKIEEILKTKLGL